MNGDPAINRSYLHIKGQGKGTNPKWILRYVSNTYISMLPLIKLSQYVAQLPKIRSVAFLGIMYGKVAKSVIPLKILRDCVHYVCRT